MRRMRVRGLLMSFLLAIEPTLLKVQAISSIQARQSSAKITEGLSFTFKWDFYLQPDDKSNLREIVFGLWEKGYTSSYLITVNKLGVAVENPQLGKKHPSYVGRVAWEGDISQSYVAFRLADIKLSDNNTYGCQLDIGGFGRTIDSKITLTVQRATVKNTSSIFVASVSPVTAGQMAEFNLEYLLSDEDKKHLTAVQLSRPTKIQHQPKSLWKLDSDGLQIINLEYTSRLIVSDETKAKRHNQQPKKRFRLRLFNITLKDEGNYVFNIDLGKRSKNLQSEVFLEVNEYPYIKTSPELKPPYAVGEQLVLACKAEGKPTPNIKWIKNGRLVPHQNGKFFFIDHLAKSDTGVYSCFASNSVGNVTSQEVHVRVQYAPSLVSPSEAQTVLSWRGHSTQLTCAAIGYPPAQYLWRRADNRPIGNNSTLTITPLADSDFTNYTCIAKNIHGQDSIVFTLKPIRPPRPPIIKHIRVNYNSIKVTWQASLSKQDTPITGHVLQIKKLQRVLKKWTDKEIKFGGKSDYFILGNLTKGTHYKVLLYATNVAGRSNASEEKQVKTPTDGFPSLVKLHFKEVSINHTSFEFTWDYPQDGGGAEVTVFTVWYRAVGLVNRTQEEWSTVNVTQDRYSLKLNCCLTYEIMVTAWNRNGQSFTDPDNAARVTVLGDLTEETTLRNGFPSNVTEPKNNPTLEVVLKYLPYLSFLAIPMLLWAVVTKIRKGTQVKLIKINEDDIEQPLNEMEQLETVPEPPVASWEFPSSNLAVERVIGHGAFGMVSKAYARDLPGKPDWTVVAVKSLQDGATEIERTDLISELNLLKKLKPHPHIIKLLGCITAGTDNPYVIVEYVPYGDLLGYLRRSRGVNDCYYDDPDIEPSTNLTSEQMLKFAWQIADGMRYISSKKIIHRDLAARNVLVGENHRCKITDFGMARHVSLDQIYLRRSEGRIPVKWTAIEAMTGPMKYSTKSDVWSFGIVLFEICTIGAEPYPGISPYKLLRILLKGYRIPKPDYFKDELYGVMLKCWETEPENRPSFDWLCSSIRGLNMSSNQNYVNIKDCLEAYETENGT